MSLVLCQHVKCNSHYEMVQIFLELFLKCGKSPMRFARCYMQLKLYVFGANILNAGKLHADLSNFNNMHSSFV